MLYSPWINPQSTFRSASVVLSGSDVPACPECWEDAARPVRSPPGYFVKQHQPIEQVSYCFCAVHSLTLVNQAKFMFFSKPQWEFGLMFIQQSFLLSFRKPSTTVIFCTCGPSLQNTVQHRCTALFCQLKIKCCIQSW